MTVRIFAIIPAMVLALSATTPLAQPATPRFAQLDRSSLIDHDMARRPHHEAGAVVSNAAYVGGGSNPSRWGDEEEQTGVPEYSTSNGAAYVTDGSESSYLADQHQPMSGPGYSVGTGAAGINRAS